jgi:hypothetical protein
MYLLPQGLVGSLRCFILHDSAECSQPLCASIGGRMRHGNYLWIGVIVLAALAALDIVAQGIVTQSLVTQANAAPKGAKPKKPLPPPPPAEVTDPELLPPISTFMTYDIGTLRMTGKKAADMTYSVGTLRMNGRGAASTIFNVGTLSMTGKKEP